MSKIKKDTIEAKELEIQVYTEDFKNVFISLTDIARYKKPHEPKNVDKNWLKLEIPFHFLRLWKTIHNLI